MEVIGAKRIFEWSIDQHKLRYSDLYGDGDSKSFSAVKDCEPMSRICKACNLKNKLRKTNITAYENWKASHMPGVGLPMEVISKVKPICNDLNSDILLSKCLHGKTQNQNESFNGMIWERLPKTKLAEYNNKPDVKKRRKIIRGRK